MNIAQKIILAMGAFYVLIGGTISIVFVSTLGALQGGYGFLAIPMLFVVLGIAFIIGALIPEFRKGRIRKRGTRYPAKIYGYVENTSYRVNGRFPINVKVHYFDRNGIEREAVLPASVSKGDSTYPIGMTIDIFEYHGKYGFDPNSVRNEILPREEELMDDKPVDPSKVRMVAVSCKSCGASYQAAEGYTGRCPYCGSYQNA